MTSYTINLTKDPLPELTVEKGDRIVFDNPTSNKVYQVTLSAPDLFDRKDKTLTVRAKKDKKRRAVKSGIEDYTVIESGIGTMDGRPGRIVIN